MRRILLLIVTLALVAVGLAFAMLNADPVAFDFFLGEARLPLSLLLVLTVAVGALVGVVASFALLWRHRREAARLRRRVAQAEKELAALRKLPLRDGSR